MLESIPVWQQSKQGTLFWTLKDNQHALVLTVNEECVGTLFLKDLQQLTLKPELELQNNQEICAVRMDCVPDSLGRVHFDHSLSLSQVIDLLNACLKDCNKHLIKTDDFYSIADGSVPTEPSAHPSRWPNNLPAPSPESAVYKAGSFGLEVLTSLLGSSTTDKLEDVGWNVLESFSKVTQMARASAASTLQHPLAKPLLPLIPDVVKNYVLDSNEAEILLEEYETAGQYLSRHAQEFRIHTSERGVEDVDQGEDLLSDLESLVETRLEQVQQWVPIEPEEWISWRDKNGRILHDERFICDAIFERGIHYDIRMDAWRFLLGLFPWNSNEQERISLLTQKATEYAAKKNDWIKTLNDYDEKHGEFTRDDVPASETAWDESDVADRITKMRERRYRIAKDVVRTDRVEVYFGGSRDGEIEPLGESPGGTVQLNTTLQMLQNILMTYSVHNFELGYVQGMNDLLAPILVTVDSEPDAFWCFEHFMEKMQVNFQKDQMGMKAQLTSLRLLIKFMDPALFSHLERADSDNMFMCFRWLLVLFKREFAMEAIISLWERIWATKIPEFHIFFAFSLLRSCRKSLLTLTAFDETLKFINNKSGHLELERSIWRASILYHKFAQRIVPIAKARLDMDIVCAQEIVQEQECTSETICTDDELWILLKLLGH